MTESEQMMQLDVHSAVDPEHERLMEDHMNGEDAGRAFAHRHILEKMNLFFEEYRRNGYSEAFVEGFIEGVNDVTGGSINLVRDDEQREGSDHELEAD